MRYCARNPRTIISQFTNPKVASTTGKTITYAGTVLGEGSAVHCSAPYLLPSLLPRCTPHHGVRSLPQHLPDLVGFVNVSAGQILLQPARKKIQNRPGREMMMATRGAERYSCDPYSMQHQASCTLRTWLVDGCSRRAQGYSGAEAQCCCSITRRNCTSQHKEKHVASDT